MDNKDEKFYFSSNYGVFIHKGQIVTQEESDPIYQKQLEYQRKGGSFDDIGDEYFDVPKEVPEKITASQIRQALILTGRNPEDVVNAISQISNDMIKNILLVRWEYETTYSRASDEVNQIGASLGMPQKEIDDLFIKGAEL